MLKLSSGAWQWLWLCWLSAHRRSSPCPGQSSRRSVPRWPDGHINLGSTPDHKGYLGKDVRALAADASSGRCSIPARGPGAVSIMNF